MSLSNARIMVATIAWGLVFFGSLSVSQMPGDWGHSVCGPWGCGPPVQALVGCHLSWIVFLLPLAVLSRNWLSISQLRMLAVAVLVCGCVGVAGVVAFDLCTWWPAATEMHRRYIWHRLGFSIVTFIDFPMLELIGIGAYLVVPSFLTYTYRNAETTEN